MRVGGTESGLTASCAGQTEERHIEITMDLVLKTAYWDDPAARAQTAINLLQRALAHQEKLMSELEAEAEADARVQFYGPRDSGDYERLGRIRQRKVREQLAREAEGQGEEP